MSARRSAREGGFDRVARAYPWLERCAFGGALQRARVALLGDVVTERALLVGEGDGRVAEALARAHAGARLTIVDASGAQLTRARARLARSGVLERCRFLQRDLLALRDHREDGLAFDLVVTPFVLDCFEGSALAELVASLAAQLRAPRDGAASWLHADFVPPAGQGVAALRRRAWTAGLYRFFGWRAGLEARRLEDPAPHLRAAGLECVRERRIRAGLLHAQLWRREARGATMP